MRALLWAAAMPIPAMITVSTAVARGARYEGRLESGQLPELAEARLMLSEELRVTLQFGRDRGHDVVRAEIDGTLDLQCERCEARFLRDLGVVSSLRLVDNDEAEQACLAEADPFRVEGERLAPAALVAQEVLLSLPVVPRCAACEDAVQADEPAAAEMPTHRPFAALLKRS
jgi:uncharacterized protein